MESNERPTEIRMEIRRLCGYRKVGALYLVGDGLPMRCKKLPLELTRCPTCNHGIKPARGWQWVDARALAFGACEDRQAPRECKENGHVVHCPFMQPLVGLLWVGRRFYTPLSFMAEAATLGVSKRLKGAAAPRRLNFGETWCLLAHPDAKAELECDHYRADKGVCASRLLGDGSFAVCELSTPRARSRCANARTVTRSKQGIFYAFKPKRLELIVTESQFREMTDEQITDYDRRHIKLVTVPDGDKRFEGSVWDEEKE